VAGDSEQFIPSRDIKHHDAFVRPGRSEPPAIRAEGDQVDVGRLAT